MAETHIYIGGVRFKLQGYAMNYRGLQRSTNSRTAVPAKTWDRAELPAKVETKQTHSAAGGGGAEGTAFAAVFAFAFGAAFTKCILSSGCSYMRHFYIELVSEVHTSCTHVSEMSHLDMPHAHIHWKPGYFTREYLFPKSRQLRRLKGREAHRKLFTKLSETTIGFYGFEAYRAWGRARGRGTIKLHVLTQASIWRRMLATIEAYASFLSKSETAAMLQCSFCHDLHSPLRKASPKPRTLSCSCRIEMCVASGPQLTPLRGHLQPGKLLVETSDVASALGF